LLSDVSAIVLSSNVSAIASLPRLLRELLAWVLASWVLLHWVLRIYRKEAISGILNVLAVETVVGLPRLRLLPITVKLTSSASLAACEDRLWEGG
jgi:hypothetical protein